LVHVIGSAAFLKPDIGTDPPGWLLECYHLEPPDWIKPADSYAITWNITPRYFYSDLHVDIDSGALAFPVGGRKIWLLFAPEHEPLSDKAQKRKKLLYVNWARYTVKQYYHQETATLFEVAAGRIQKWYIGYTESNTGVYIPPG
jgi:hypothetical protein